MGLAIEVGYLKDMSENDEEGVLWINEEFDKMNGYLSQLGIPNHQEPREAEVWSFDMYGYSGLHYLRRIAAHVNKTGKLPSPGNQDSSKDTTLEKYFENFTNPKSSGIFSLFQKKVKREFEHLIIHSDAEGYYLPIDFDQVLIPPEELEIPGGMIGSSVRLLAECERLAALLDIPKDLDPEENIVWEAADSQGEGEKKWERYGVESYVCLGLIKACRLSLRDKTAVVFC
tara:strand:+ start:65 stop:751 length:687 start_codon:yes stop_codon:yes gene_type:complete